MQIKAATLPYGSACWRMVQRNEKGHAFDLDTGACWRCGMTLKEYEDHGRPPCPGAKGDRQQAPERGGS